MAGLRVLVLFGGRSGEHEVSVKSARLVADALDAIDCVVHGAGITLEGRVVSCDPRKVHDRVPEDADPYRLPTHPLDERDVDVAFPVLHGPYGEDGSVQGLLELADLAYVGARVDGSVICIDKVLQKKLFAAAGLPIVDHVGVSRADWSSDREDVLARAESLGLPCYAKPARLGSSVGISKVRRIDDLPAAIERALRHDDVVLVEASGGPRELEVGVLGGVRVDVSVPGEPISHGDFYDYRSKYTDEGCELRVPAEVPADVAQRTTEYARRAFAVSRCDGLARVDFFWDDDAGRLLVNEINSIPGMTPTSMFPRVWEASGVPFPQVVGRLLEDALERHAHKSRLEAARAAAHDEEVGATT